MPHNLENINFLVITHSPIPTGPALEFANYIRPQVTTLLVIEHPFSYAKEKNSSAKMYLKGDLQKHSKVPSLQGPDIFFYIKDVIVTLYFVLLIKKKFDYCVSADNLNTFSAILLKKLGLVNKVIFMTVDYTPQRFENKFLNSIYHKLDKFCCYHADIIWNSAEIMEKMRFESGIQKDKTAKQIVVPDGSNFDQIERLPFEKIKRYDIVFMGNLLENKGIMLLLEAFPQVFIKVKNANLIIIGEGPLRQQLEEKTLQLGISNNVKFTGYIEKHSDLEKLISLCGVAVAPYVPDPDSYSFYSDVGKVKVYLACGLPVVITPVPQIAYEIEKNKAGIMVKYTKEDISQAILKIFLDEDIHREYRKNAENMVSEFSWTKVFDRALTETFSYLK